MTRRALHPDQRSDLVGHVDVALREVRLVIEAAPDVGAVLIEGYRCLSALRKLLDVVDELPEVGREADA